VKCICALPEGHDQAHECYCGGSWTLSADGEYVTIRLPGGIDPDLLDSSDYGLGA
jgi:hypothetical protein